MSSLKRALYVHDCHELTAADDFKFVKKCLGTMWRVDEYKYSDNNPDAAVGILNWEAMRYDLLIGKGLGGYIVMAADTDADKIVINPFLNLRDTLGFYLVDTMTICRWESYMPVLEAYNISGTRVIVGTKCEYPSLSYDDSFLTQFEDVMTTVDAGHQLDASVGEVLSKLTYI